MITASHDVLGRGKAALNSHDVLWKKEGQLLKSQPSADKQVRGGAGRGAAADGNIQSMHTYSQMKNYSSLNMSRRCCLGL